MDHAGVEAVAERAAEIVEGAYNTFAAEFGRLTRTAHDLFENRDWVGVQRLAVERLDLYSRIVLDATGAIKDLLGDRARDKDTWRLLKTAYFGRVGTRGDVDLAETFFNSVTRRIFTTVGVDPAVEFVATEAPERALGFGAVTTRWRREGSLLDLVRAVLDEGRFRAGYEDIERDARLVEAAIVRALPGEDIREIETARPLFFRNKAAYIVGRLRGHVDTPMLVALLNESGRVRADAVLLTEDEVSIVFSFARSYFLVDTAHPVEMVAFLSTIMPKKPVNELYNAIGHNKHGKTEFYRALLRHLAESEDRFEIAPGVRGMVMIVFTLASYDVVFKIIRDRFDYPKTVSRAEVMGKYRLVFRHDRAGRLVDAQEFEHLEFERRRFAPDLLEILARDASETVTVTDTTVVIRHLYTERRLIPLDLFMREAPPEAACLAALDYGQVLRDLAATNIFPGDLLLKNFGVSRHGRVIFYDYDELALVTECNFRSLPPPRDDMDEGGAEPWFYVGEKDVFPEEFLPFLGFRGAAKDAFLAAHGELLAPEFWRRMQDEHRAGRVPDIQSYRSERRLLVPHLTPPPLRHNVPPNSDHP